MAPLRTTSRRTDCVSTRGVSPVTVTDSSTAPPRMSTFTAMTPEPDTARSSRFTVENPGSENVNAYVPGRRSVTRYWPVPSLTTVRVFSMSAGLEISTLTPGRTAAEASRTTPAIVACANTRLGSSRIPAAAVTTFRTRIIADLPQHRRQDQLRLDANFGGRLPHSGW